MDEVDQSIESLCGLLTLKAPKICPTVFPSQFPLRKLHEFCVNDAQHESVKRYFDSKSCNSDSMILCTKIDYPKRSVKIYLMKSLQPLDQKLVSLENIMSLLVQGSQDEINVAVNRFSEVNKWSGDFANNSRLFQEVYNAAYAIKILLRLLC